jgi:Tfp pilus assembly protein PilF
MTARAAALAAMLALTACSSPPLRGLFETTKGSSVLSAGLREYEEGDYAEAGQDLQTALDLGLSDSESATAHKYLAFIHCSSGRERLCREEFRRALALKPDLELSAAEAGHPVWGPLFAQLKGAASPFKLALDQYEAGNYDESAKNFQGALREGLSDKERVSAHKHLAFIHCASSRERQCRDEFRRALAVDPSLELDAAEAGHPVWGPIFRQVKAGRESGRQ